MFAAQKANKDLYQEYIEYSFESIRKKSWLSNRKIGTKKKKTNLDRHSTRGNPQMATTHKKLTSLLIREMQNKTTEILLCNQ